MPAPFDRYGDDYEAAVDRAIAFAGQPHDAYVQAKARKLLELARRRLGGEPGSALDVGCGVGLTDRYLVGHVGSLHGVDVSEAMVERARAAVPGAEFRVGDGDTLPYEDDRFDVAFASCVLHHVDAARHAAVLGEMRRVVRPAGLVVVFEHNPWNPLTRRVVRSCAFDEGVTLLHRRDVLALAAAADLDVTDAEYILFFPWRTRLFEALERPLSRVPIGAQYVVAGRRAA